MEILFHLVLSEVFYPMPTMKILLYLSYDEDRTEEAGLEPNACAR